MDPLLQEGSHGSKAEGQNHFPRSVGHIAFSAAHDIAGFLGCKLSETEKVHASNTDIKF